MLTVDTPLSGGEESSGSLWLRVFRRVLEDSDVDIEVAIEEDTNFFNVGGHSLLIPLLLSRYESASGWRPPASLIFRCPSPRQLEEASAMLRAEAAAEEG
ncbi:hypothetical protein ABH935_006424 [Catenulispora sp. GAS73]|uniref:acyl carrier protein n=1 Tax=Catenulispora sp. GAS73 TaxID=3156269 RepID=UPI0035142D09